MKYIEEENFTFSSICNNASSGEKSQFKNKEMTAVVTDPPYKFENQGGGFDAKNKSTQRVYLDSLKNNTLNRR